MIDFIQRSNFLVNLDFCSFTCCPCLSIIFIFLFKQIIINHLRNQFAFYQKIYDTQIICQFYSYIFNYAISNHSKQLNQLLNYYSQPKYMSNKVQELKHLIKSPRHKLPGYKLFRSSKALHQPHLLHQQQKSRQDSLGKTVQNQQQQQINNPTPLSRKKALPKQRSLRVLDNIKSSKMLPEKYQKPDYSHLGHQLHKIGMPFRKKLQLKKLQTYKSEQKKEVKSQQLIQLEKGKRNNSRLKFKVKNPFQKRMKLDEQFKQSFILAIQDSLISEQNKHEIAELLEFI